MHCQSSDIEDSVSGVIPVLVKIKKMEDSASPHFGVHKVGILGDFLQQWLHYKVSNHPINQK